MNIAYIGPISISILANEVDFGVSIPVPRLKYAHGARLVLGLLPRGNTASVITLCDGLRKIERYHTGNLTIYLVPERRTRYQMLTFFHKEVALMRTCLQEICPDVVFSQWTYMYSRAALVSGFPVLVVGRDSPWRVAHLMKSIRMWHRAFYSKMFVAPKLQYLTTISPHMVSELAKWWGKTEGKISVIPNAIPDNVVNRQKKRINRQASTIACVTDWNELKNVKSLLRAFCELKKKHSSWRLVVYGASMSREDAAGEWLRSNGFSLDGIELRGYCKQEDIRHFLFEEADVFCSPSLEESFGMVFLEAMAQGVPCVGGEKSGAVPWVLGVEKVEGGESCGGVVCDVTRPEKLAECLERVMLDWELRKKLSAGGVLRAKTVFNMETVVRQYEQKLMEIAKCE